MYAFLAFHYMAFIQLEQPRFRIGSTFGVGYGIGSVQGITLHILNKVIIAERNWNRSIHRCSQ